jgi:hypothetical protein
MGEGRKAAASVRIRSCPALAVDGIDYTGRGLELKAFLLA